MTYHPEPEFLVLWLQGQQVEVCSTHAIILFMHIHAQKGSLKDLSNVSHKTHEDPYGYRRAPILPLLRTD